MALSRPEEKQLRALLGRPIPRDYLTLMRTFPAKLHEGLAARGADDEQPLFREVSTVIRENRLAREDDCWTEDGPWPGDQLMIGSEIGGDRFSLSVSKRPAVVFRFMHETGEFERIGTLRTYVQAVKRWLREDAETITEALESAGMRKKRQAAESAWDIERLAQATEAPRMEDRAKLSGNADDWGDATLFYNAADRIPDALRCCEQWIARSPGEPFPLTYKVELLGALVSHEVGPKQRRDLAGQYREVFEDLHALHAAHIAAAEAALATARLAGDPGGPEAAELDLELARRAATKPST